jgi:hypothetical protein
MVGVVMVGSTTTAPPTELCILARLLSDLATVDCRPAKTIPLGEEGKTLRALNTAARGGVARAAAFVKPRLADRSAATSKVHPVVFVLRRSELYSDGVWKRACEKHGHRQALLMMTHALFDLDPRLALWTLGVLGTHLAERLSDEPPLDALHRTLDLIAGLPEQSAAPITVLWNGSGRLDARETIAAGLLNAVLAADEREAFALELLQAWQHMFASCWLERSMAKRPEHAGTVDLGSARLRRQNPSDAFYLWMAKQMRESIRDYPAR